MLSVSFDLPAGWVELPPPGTARKDVFRRNPYGLLARGLVTSGAVIKPLSAATARYLERVASGAPDALGLATLVRAPSREKHTFVTFVVFPGPPAGRQPLEEMASRRGGDRESEHSLAPAELQCGPAVRATYTRRRMEGAGDRPFVQYWAEPRGAGQVIIALGDIDAPVGADVGEYVNDIDHLARTMTVQGMDERHG